MSVHHVIQLEFCQRHTVPLMLYHTIPYLQTLEHSVIVGIMNTVFLLVLL